VVAVLLGLCCPRSFFTDFSFALFVLHSLDITEATSKRVACAMRYKIEKKVRQAHAKQRRANK
jgi:hypothetical protein